ncbi:MAG TPA: MaoC/PaaZ C-terminal domain-containing protein [Herpetosiphonaceae bacterium]
MSELATLAAGDELPARRFGPVTQEQINAYAEASGDMNPIHRDPEFAAMVGLGGTIAHGMLVMGLAGAYLAELAGPANLRQFGARFKAMTRPGETIVCSGRVTEISDEPGGRVLRCEIRAANEAGEIKLTGHCVAFAAKEER